MKSYSKKGKNLVNEVFDNLSDYNNCFEVREALNKLNKKND